jgi:hypothetical protein
LILTGVHQSGSQRGGFDVRAGKRREEQVAGMSAAMALILGLCIMTVSYLQLRLMRANTLTEGKENER